MASIFSPLSGFGWAWQFVLVRSGAEQVFDASKPQLPQQAPSPPLPLPSSETAAGLPFQEPRELPLRMQTGLFSQGSWGVRTTH